MRKQGSLRNLMASASRLRFSILLIAAAVLHVSVTLAVTLSGYYGLAPAHFDARGVGISFAGDSLNYLNHIAAVSSEVERSGTGAWLRSDMALHVRLYSISFALAGRWLGFTVLSAEPLNLIYYLLILSLVFALGRELFDRGAGILAAGAAALWPSLLLHTTQLLRDPLFLTLLLVIIFLSVSWLTRTYSWQRGLMAGAGGGVAGLLVWLVRSQIWEVLFLAAILSTLFLIIRQVRERKFAAGNLIGAALMCAFLISAPVVGRAFNIYSYPAEQSGEPRSAQAENPGMPGAPVNNRLATAQPTLPPGSSLPARISFIRQKFLISYPSAGSNIDTHVEFRSFTDILIYLPRAMAIGLFAPFPNMWFERGTQTGMEGRLLSGLETLLIYLVEALAAYALWMRRGLAQAWLLMLMALAGMLALGLVVPNMAALYRMRYGFWLLLIIFGAEGLRQISLRKRAEGNG